MLSKMQQSYLIELLLAGTRSSKLTWLTTEKSQSNGDSFECQLRIVRNIGSNGLQDDSMPTFDERVALRDSMSLSRLIYECVREMFLSSMYSNTKEDLLVLISGLIFIELP